MITPAAAAWLFGEEEVVGKGRFNTTVPSGHEVDALVLAQVVVVRAAWGLRERGALSLCVEAAAPVKRRRFLGLQVQVGEDAPKVRAHPAQDFLEASVEGVLIGLLHGRRPKPGPIARIVDRIPDPWSIFDPLLPEIDRTDLGAAVANSFSADAWLKLCREEVEAAGLDRASAEPIYRASEARWNVFRENERPLLDALNRVVADAIRFTSISTR